MDVINFYWLCNNIVMENLKRIFIKGTGGYNDKATGRRLGRCDQLQRLPRFGCEDSIAAGNSGLLPARETCSLRLRCHMVSSLGQDVISIGVIMTLTTSKYLLRWCLVYNPAINTSKHLETNYIIVFWGPFKYQLYSLPLRVTKNT